jgi:hypothetical protein
MVEEPMAAMGMALVDAPQLVQEIAALSAGRPDVVQAICQRMIARAHERGDRNLTADDVIAIRHSSEFREFFFEAVWGNASPLERLITVLMADRETFKADDVVATLESEGYTAPIHAVRDGLDALDLCAILQREDGEYRFAAGALPQVMAEANLIAGLKRGLLDSLSEAMT